MASLGHNELNSLRTSTFVPSAGGGVFRQPLRGKHWMAGAIACPCGTSSTQRGHSYDRHYRSRHIPIWTVTIETWRVHVGDAVQLGPHSKKWIGDKRGLCKACEVSRSSLTRSTLTRSSLTRSSLSRSSLSRSSLTALQSKPDGCRTVRRGLYLA